MAEFTATIEVAASPADAYAYLRDIAHRPEWDPSVRRVEPLDDADGNAGDRYDAVVGFYGKALEATYEIAELEEPSRIVITTEGRAAGRDVIEIAPRGDGAAITLSLSVRLSGMARLLDRGLQVAFAGIGENAVAGVRKKLGPPA